MRSKRLYYLAFGVILIVAVLGSSLANVGAQDMKVMRVGRSVGGDLNTIDPSIAEVADELQVIEQLFVGLTAQDEKGGALLPSLASSWEVSEDGLTYTFHLVEGISWVRYNPDTDAVEQVMDESGNPRMVTAQDLLYGWQRSLDPATASTYAFLPAGYVVGGEDYLSGAGTFEDVAIKAVDDYTVTITQNEPVGFAPYIYGLWMVRPMPKWAIDAAGDEWTEPENINSYGPYALKDWEHEVSVTLVKNPFWVGTADAPQAKIDEIDYIFLDPPASFAEYQAGNLDYIANAPVEEMDFIRSDPTLSAELNITTRDCTYYLGIDNTEPPLSQSAHLRLALSYAIDRQSIVDNVTKGGQIPAQWFSRPGLIAAPTLDTDPDLGVMYDPEKAKEELALGLQDLGLSSVDELPEIVAAYPDSSNHGQIMQAIQQMWTDTLGITVQLTGMDPTTYFTVVSEDAPAIYRSGWCSDYPDADNFLRTVLRSDSEQNDPGYANAEFDALVDQARLENDLETRRDLYAQAEEILVAQDSGIIPLYWYTYVQLIKPNVEFSTPDFGHQRWAKWDLK